MKKLKITLGGLALGALMALVPFTSQGTIIGSKHDFSIATNYWVGGTNNWTVGFGSTNVCGECHTIHHAPDPARGPLWIHTPTANTFKTYDQSGSETFPSGLTVTLGSSSKACLSCHDGSIAINSQDSGATPGTTTTVKGGTGVFIAPSAIVVEVAGGQDDLTHMHPIGVNYASAISYLPTAALNPITTPIGGGSISTVMLKNGNVECSSCHDIHRTQGTSSTSGIYTVASGQALCLTCHNK
ncbi:MAG TPA: cytochrome c3 family protein [Verrucomicrobiae bacterium]|nr:cytochrome c3 family protein [Verrucomicrobiae bacterium]